MSTRTLWLVWLALAAVAVGIGYLLDVDSASLIDVLWCLTPIVMLAIWVFVRGLRGEAPPRIGHDSTRDRTPPLTPPAGSRLESLVVHLLTRIQHFPESRACTTALIVGAAVGTLALCWVAAHLGALGN